MRRNDFTHCAPGRLVQVSGGIAFLPNLLPPEIPPSWVLTRAIEHARATIAELSARLAQMPNPEHLLHPLRRREAVLSSRIEGTITRVRDVLVAEAAPARATIADEDTREVLNYLDALEFGRQRIADGHPVHLALLRGLHQALMQQNVRGADWHPGTFRSIQVQIGGVRNDLTSARFVPPPPEQVSPLIDDLMAFVSREPVYGPLVECAIMHYQFETIHPFEDGNGRTGRLLIPLYLQAKGAIDRPVLYLSEYFERRRDDYLELLYRVSAKGDWLSWIEFVLTAVTEQARGTSDKARRVAELHRLYTERARTLSSKAALRAIDLIVERPIVSVSDVAAFAGTSYQTAKTGLEQLTEAGVVSASGRSHGRGLYIADELMSELYEV